MASREPWCERLGRPPTALLRARWRWGLVAVAADDLESGAADPAELDGDDQKGDQGPDADERRARAAVIAVDVKRVERRDGDGIERDDGADHDEQMATDRLSR